MTEKMQALVVRTDGTTEETGLAYEDIRRAIGNLITWVDMADVAGCYVDDEGILNGLPLNVPVSMATGRPLFGTAVVMGSGTTNDGDNVPIHPDYADFITHLAMRWHSVVEGAARLGMKLEFQADPSNLPPAQIVEIPEGMDIGEFLRQHAEGTL